VLRQHRSIAHSIFLSLFFLVITLVSNAPADTGQRPDLVVAYSPKVMVDVDPREAAVAFGLYVQELAKGVGRTATSRPYENSEIVMKDVEEGRVDLLIIGPVDYLRLKNREILKPGISCSRGGKPTSRYLILVQGNKGYTKIADLKGRRITAMKGDPVANLFLSTTLLRLKFGEPETFFSQVDEKMKPSQAILSVFFGQADACVVNEVPYRTMAEMNPQLDKGLKVLAASSELPEAIGLFRKGMDEEIKQKTMEVTSHLKAYPRGRQFLALFKVDALMPLRESDLCGIKDLVGEYDRLKQRR
jgi:ABC-type phosphate/phosphonate transport system substrate-binding protein